MRVEGAERIRTAGSSPSTETRQDDAWQAAIDAILSDPNGGLTPEEAAYYDRLRDEMVKARRAAERFAHTFWLREARS